MPTRWFMCLCVLIALFTEACATTYDQLSTDSQRSTIANYVSYLREHVKDVHAAIASGSHAGALLLVPRPSEADTRVEALPPPHVLYGDTPIEAVRANFDTNALSKPADIDSMKRRFGLCIFINRASDPQPVRPVYCADLFYHVIMERLVASRFDEARVSFAEIEKDLQHQRDSLDALGNAIDATEQQITELSRSLNRSMNDIDRDIRDTATFKREILNRLDIIRKKLEAM